MKVRKRKRKRSKVELKPGTLLMAKPFWEDEVYKRAVVLITIVDKERTVGVIINKMSSVLIREALPEIDSDEHVYFGGMLNSMEITCLHSISELPGAVSVAEDLYYGGNAVRIVEMSDLNALDFKKIKFVAGLLKWTPSGLKKEIKEDKWWLSTITASELFDLGSETLWSYKLLQSGNMYGLFAHVPDPSLAEKVAENFHID